MFRWRGRHIPTRPGNLLEVAQEGSATVPAMPELPEVETVRRGLAPLLTGRQIVDASGHPSAKFNSAGEAVGATVTSVGRRGKYLLAALDDARDLVIHLGMTGQLRVEPADRPSDPYDRASWILDDGNRLAYRDVRRFGRVAVIGQDRSALPTLAALGPEPIADDGSVHPDFTVDHLWRTLRRSQMPVKAQLLGQRVVAGVGNIYADEALWSAGIHPSSRRISRARAEVLRDAIAEVLAAGVRHGGTTLRDYRTATGESGQNQHHLECYGRAGEPCSRCGTELRRSIVGGRGTTHCPRCQRR